MTRINVIPVEALTDQHLMAEYRELPMVHAALHRTKKSKGGIQNKKIPPSYTLNKGHVTFFYNKGLFLRERFDALVDELRSRGYSVSPDNRQIDWSVFDNTLLKSWTPCRADVEVNLERIVQRVREKTTPWYRYRGQTIAFDQYMAVLREFGLLNNNE